MIHQKVDALIEGWRAELVQKLAAWINIASINAPATGEGAPFGRAVRAMLDLALADAREMGFETRVFDGYAGDISMGRGARTMGILAHLDVVPAGDGWTFPPFGGVVKGGKMYGRGVVDDKGPAIAALYAMRAVREAGVPLRDGVRLILGCDEETGMSDMRHYASQVELPDYGFSPDAEYPLINIEKGGSQILLGALAQADEGARIPIYEMEAGERINVVPGTAWAIVGTARVSAAALNEKLAAICAAQASFALRAVDLGNGRARIEASGKSAHASTPHLGVNTAGMLLVALCQLEAGGTCAPLIAALAERLGMAHDGAGLGIAASDELSGALTCNLGLLRYDGAVLSAQLDIRYPLCAREETICGQIALATCDTGLYMRRMGGHVPLHVPAEHEVVQGLLAVYHELTGLPAAPIAIGGGTYSRTMPNTVAFGIHFPGSPDPCHMPDEYIDLDELMLSVRIMAHAIIRLAGA